MKEDIFDFDIEQYEIGKSYLRYVNFPSFYGLQKVSAPFFIHRASKEISPCLVVTACVHGDEINGLRIAQSIIKSKLKLLKGTLIVIPTVNIYGFLTKNRYLPDRKDLNRCFPGSSKGSFGARFANFIFKTITQHGDVFIDLHSGPPGRFNIPQLRCDLSTEGTRDLVNSFSIPIIVDSSLRDGSMRGAINDLQKPCIVFEGGEGLRIDETITKYGTNLIRSALSHLGMIKSKTSFKADKIIISKTKWIRAKEGGLLVNKAKKGKLFKEGDVLGELRSISGNLVTKIKMEHDGIILGMSKSALIMSGDALYNVGIFGKEDVDEEEEFFDVFDFEM